MTKDEKDEIVEQKKIRFKIGVLHKPSGAYLFYKRYAFTEDEAKKILDEQLLEDFGKDAFEIKECYPDKTKTIEK